MNEMEQREDLIRKLEFQAPLLVAINARVERTGGLDASINRSKAMTIGYIDKLLDQYNVVGLSAIPTLEDPDDETTTGGWEQDPIDVRGTD